LSEVLKISERGIRTALNHLKATSEIAIKTTNKYSIITVLKWEEYQSNIEKWPAKWPAKWQSNDQQTTTTKEVKNTKEEIGEISLLDKTIKEFSNMRSKIKKPLTPKANSMLINKLTKLGNSDSEKVMLLEQSIFHCRQDIYPLKDEYKLDNPKIFRKYLNEWKTDYLKEMMGVDKFMEIKKQLLSN